MSDLYSEMFQQLPADSKQNSASLGFPLFSSFLPPLHQHPKSLCLSFKGNKNRHCLIRLKLYAWLWVSYTQNAFYISSLPHLCSKCPSPMHIQKENIKQFLLNQNFHKFFLSLLYFITYFMVIYVYLNVQILNYMVLKNVCKYKTHCNLCHKEMHFLHVK